MSVKVTKRKPTDLDWDVVAAETERVREANERARLAQMGMGSAEIDRNIAIRKLRDHQCNTPKVDDEWGPGTVFKCDFPGCGREKQLVVGAPDYETGKPALAWRNLPQRDTYAEATRLKNN